MDFVPCAGFQNINLAKPLRLLHVACRPSTAPELVAHDLFGGCLSPNPLDRGKTSPWDLAKSSPLSSPEPPSECSSARQELGYCLLLAIGRASEVQYRGDRAILTVGCLPRFIPQQFGAVCGKESSQSSMHLRSRNLPRPSASSPPGNRSHLMANSGQAPDLEGLHREIHDMAEQMRIMNENNGRLIQLLATANPPLPAAPPVPDIERSRHSNRSGDRSQNVSANRVGRGDAKHQARPYVKRVPRNLVKLQPGQEGGGVLTEATISGHGISLPHKRFEIWTPDSTPSILGRMLQNRQKNASHLFTVHQKETESLKDFVKRFNQAILEVEDPSDKVIIMAMMEGLRPDPLFDSLSKNVPETLSALQSKADKKEEYGDNRPTAGNIQTIHGGFGSGGCSTSSRKRHARSAFRLAEEEIYNLSSPYVGDQPPITFSNDDLRGLHLPHDDALVVSAVIANFNVQRILIDNGSSADILFVSAFEKNENFIMVDCPSPYNAILGRPTLGGIKAITSTYHLKFRPLNSNYKTWAATQSCSEMKWSNSPWQTPRETNNTQPLEEVVPISIHPDYPDRHIMIGTELADELRSTLVNFLKKNYDVFAWSQGDVPSIDPEIAMHKLFTNPESSPVRQKRRKFAPERLKVIEDEVDKLIRANIVREAHYPDWLANVVVAPKKKREMEGVCRFHRPQQGLPKRQSKCTLLTFEKTSFITERGLYCYKVMPFGLKNAGATYQRLVNKMFKEQIGKTMEVYIDDMLVKSIRSSDHIAHLEEAFSILRRHRMMLNPSKCIFGVSSGKFLGFLVTKRGIEVNPDQIQALIAMSSPRNIREVQQLTGRVAALNRFVSKSADKCLPFFRILRKSQAFQWNEESENAFQQLKEYLGSPPFTHSPHHRRRPLLIFIHLAHREARYPKIEKLAYALMIAARKLRHYFQAHPIIVLTDQPLKHILQRPDTSGRLLKWSVELSEFHIEYKPRTAIKAQALADFIVESTHEDTPQPETPPPEAGIPKEPTSAKDLAHWILFVDGSSNQHGCGAGLVIQAPSGEQMEYAIRMGFKATNNEAEYEALLAGLRVATELGAQSLDIFSDSQLVVNQVQWEYLAKDARMIAYLDELAQALGSPTQILQTEESPTWMDEIVDYLQEGTLPTDKLQARRLQYRSARFCIFKGRLYKRSFSGPLLKCLQPEEAEYVLKEIHEGICGNHSGARSLARKTIRQGYFWPTIERDAAMYTKKCDKCQRFTIVSHLPHTEMVPMSSPWPFAQWGIDILGPLPQAPLQRKFLIVPIDYFTKWIEAQPLAKITEKNTRDFVWKYLVCRFGIPKVIISDNARQFDNDKFRTFCSDLAISHHFSSPGHPQANGQVEVTNRTILRNLKARLDRSKSEWAEDLPSILWAYHTTSRIPTGETPYSMVFGTKSVIPVEIGMPSFRTSNFDEEESNGAELKLNLDLLEEKKRKGRTTPSSLQKPSRQIL
ncbi:hypothetical protein Acr_17g0007750 [Actinidia rufa]|uniref:Uncharacterized protein n=1 Tax=Actinidia rufa TaxID=165716 RepID=A0A7J0G348_9ERIC|nr:hypothetical protein Acr_17g0007750 [Actinidia rufa]